MQVKVAIDLALDRLFTYEAMELVGEGDGKGIVLKPVKAIVDETPFFSAALLKLVAQIAAYTASPLETVLHAAIPAAESASTRFSGW